MTSSRRARLHVTFVGLALLAVQGRAAGQSTPAPMLVIPFETGSDPRTWWLGEGAAVLLADDLLATGGTAGAALKLMQETGANVLGSVFFIELGFLGGRDRVQNFGPVRAVITF